MTNNSNTHEKINDVIKDINKKAKEIRLSLAVIDYDAPYLLHYDVTLHMPPYGNAKNKVYDFLSRIDLLKSITILSQK